MDTLKNKLTNWLAVGITIATATAAALEAVPEGSKWYVYVGALIMAILAYVTGKDSNLKAKDL